MSDVMLHGVLNMPPNLWCDSPIDIAQRHSRYKEASQRIEHLERELAEARERLAKVINDYETAVLREHRMREQRDTLAEACRKLMKVVGAPGTNEWQEIKECDAAYLAGKKALAAVKGGSHE